MDENELQILSSQDETETDVETMEQALHTLVYIHVREEVLTHLYKPVQTLEHTLSDSAGTEQWGVVGKALKTHVVDPVKKHVVDPVGNAVRTQRYIRKRDAASCSVQQHWGSSSRRLK